MKTIDMKKIYAGTCYGCHGYEGSCLPAKDLEIGTKVICLASRLSASNWQRKTNVNHGWVPINGTVTDILPNGERVVELNQDEVNMWEKPIGKETEMQSVGRIGHHVDHIIKVY
jgi:hypothetical protein